MGKNVITADKKTLAEKEKNLLRLELAEIREISELIFSKLEKKIKVIETLEASVDKKIASFQHLMLQPKGATSHVADSFEASLNKKMATLQQMFRQSEAVKSQAVAAIEASVDKKIAAFEQLVHRAELFEKKSQAVRAVEIALDKKADVLERLLQRAEALDKKLQIVESLDASIDKKIGALELLARRTETLKALGGPSNRQHEIVSLARKGLKTGEIAEVLDMPQGEVDLILELFQQKA